MYLYSDSQIPKIIASMRPYVNSKKLEVNMVVHARRRSTLLHFASALGRSKLVNALIAAGANTIADVLSDTVHIVDVNKRTALHHAARAARRRDLFSAGAYYARQLVNVLEVVYADAPSLVPQVVNAQDIHGNTALHYACRTGNYQLVRILLAVGGAHDLSNANNETPNDLARSDPRVLALLYRTPDCVEPFREEREAALSEYDYEQENGGCPEEDEEDVFLDVEEGLVSEDHDSEYDDLERPPNGRPGARDLHEQTMAQLDAFYGGRVEKILATLQPSVTGIVRAGVEAIRKRLLDHYRLTETLLQPKGNAYVAARQQLNHSRQDFSELMGARARMRTLCDVADELSERVDKRVADRTAALAAAAQEAETRQAAEALADVMELTTDGTNTRKRDASSKADQDDEPVSKVRRFSVTSNPAPGPAAFSTPPRGSASTTLQDEIILTPPPPFFMGSHREQSVNLVGELTQLQQAVARAERARKAVQKDLANIRASRKSKDDKFRRIIAACVQCPLEAVDELIAPLIGITDESHDSLIVV
ncbi:hypothetical protein HKX48_006892 [Thoreauomyces humboldtii]|nr:hypothetical protein HKX48_006892 [Thoreauomyces humboldtii]